MRSTSPRRRASAATTGLVTAGLNLAVAAWAYLSPSRARVDHAPDRGRPPRLALVVAFTTGLCVLALEVAWLGARAAKLPSALQSRRSYGMEFDLGAKYTPFDHLEILGGGGIFLPGSYFTEYNDEDFTEGFDRPAIGGQLSTRIKF